MKKLNNNVKSSRTFVKGGKMCIDYYTYDGKRHRFSTSMSDTKHNKIVIERQKYDLAEEHYERNRPCDAKTLLGDIAMIALKSEQSNRGKQLQLDYENIYKKKIAPKFAKMQLGEIKPAHINEWKNNLISKGISSSRFNSHHTTFNMILKYAFWNEYIDLNPMDRVSRKSKQFTKSPDKSGKYYTPKEVKLILENATGMMKPFLTFLFQTGSRLGEAMGLQWKFVDFEKNRITIAHAITDGELKDTKTGKVRTVDMTTELKRVLLEYQDECISNRWVFPSSRTGQPHYDSNSLVRNGFKKLLKKVGVEYRTLYASRHSFASNLIAQNAPMPYVQRALGHASLNTTLNFYTKNGHIMSEGNNEYLEKLYG